MLNISWILIQKSNLCNLLVVLMVHVSFKLLQFERVLDLALGFTMRQMRSKCMKNDENLGAIPSTNCCRDVLIVIFKLVNKFF